MERNLQTPALSDLIAFLFFFVFPTLLVGIHHGIEVVVKPSQLDLLTGKRAHGFGLFFCVCEQDNHDRDTPHLLKSTPMEVVDIGQDKISWRMAACAYHQCSAFCFQSLKCCRIQQNC